MSLIYFNGKKNLGRDEVAPQYFIFIKALHYIIKYEIKISKKASIF
jgi:hypothetical protein